MEKSGGRSRWEQADARDVGPARGLCQTLWTNLGRLPLRVFSIGKYALQKKDARDVERAARENRTRIRCAAGAMRGLKDLLSAPGEFRLHLFRLKFSDNFEYPETPPFFCFF
jgi:hypothetical protein